VLVAVLLVVWLATRGGTATEECEDAECTDALALNLSATPTAAGRSSAPSYGIRPTPAGAVVEEPAPQTTGWSAVLLEEPCGAIVYGFNYAAPLAPASITKVATALVAAENADMDEVVAVEVDGAAISAASDATIMGLRPGDRLSLRDLLNGLLLRSGNDAAIAIAEHVAGSEAAFAELMNAKASELGLTDTHFENPHGLDDPGHYTSAYDIAVLGEELLRNPDLAAIVRARSYEPAWDRGPLENMNLLLTNVPGAIGIKTGYTDLAAQTIVGAAERDGRRLIVSVLHSQDLFVDAGKLLEWGFASTEPACADSGQALEIGR
jgi:D-alanyl-D-alanine carboxypeptidase